MILESAIGGQLISVSVRNPAHFAYIYGTWASGTELKLESCALNPPKLCEEPWEDGEFPFWNGDDVRSLSGDQSEDFYICKGSPV